MKKLILSFVIAALLGAFGVFVASGQDRKNPQLPKPPPSPNEPTPNAPSTNGEASAAPACPTVNMTTSNASVFAPQPVSFTVAVNSQEANISPFYTWTVSAGTITSGQGTTSIRVDTADAGQVGSIAAEVFITGYAPTCPVTGSATVEVKIRPEARKVGEYGEIKLEDEEAQLESAAGELQSDPANKLFLIVYRSAKTKPGAIEPIMQRATTFLATKQSVPLERVERIYGERRDPPAIELWVVPPGAGPPKPSVSATPTPSTPPAKRPT